MGVIKGQKEYEKFEEGKKLTRKQAMLAQCFVCNGLDEGGDDCKGTSCPLYQFMVYRAGKGKKKVSAKQLESLRRAREVKRGMATF